MKAVPTFPKGGNFLQDFIWYFEVLAKLLKIGLGYFSFFLLHFHKMSLVFFTKQSNLYNKRILNILEGNKFSRKNFPLTSSGLIPHPWKWIFRRQGCCLSSHCGGTYKYPDLLIPQRAGRFRKNSPGSELIKWYI